MTATHHSRWHRIGLGVCLCLGLIGLLFSGRAAAQIPENPALEDPARVALTEAFDHRYTWDPDFPGFAAEVSVRYDKQMYRGRVNVFPDLSVRVINVTQPDVEALIRDTLAEVATHRERRSFADQHGESEFRLVSESAAGLVVEETSPTGTARYTLNQNQIQRVERQLGPVAVEVDALAAIRPPEGYLTTEYLATFRDPASGEILSQKNVRDYYMKVSKYYLLHRRLVREADGQPLPAGGLPETEVIFSGVNALSALNG